MDLIKDNQLIKAALLRDEVLTAINAEGVSLPRCRNFKYSLV